MQQNFAHALAREFVYEGGLANVPGDPGGLTNKGITQATFTNWLERHGVRSSSVANITDAQLYAIYKGDYWDRIKGDDLPTGIDLCMFDAAVNSGVSASVSWAQAVLGITVDGDMGPKTKQALIDADAGEFVRDFCARRMGSLKRLRTWSKFGKGWSARVANVQKTCVAWIESGGDVPGPDPVQVSPIGGQNKADVSTIPASRTSSIVAQAGTVGGVVVAGATQITQSLSNVPSDVFTFIKYVVGGMTILGGLAGIIVLVSQKWNDNAASGQAKATVDTNADATSITVPMKTALAQVTPPAPTATVQAGVPHDG
jgi:lysozyme family protein